MASTVRAARARRGAPGLAPSADARAEGNGDAPAAGTPRRTASEVCRKAARLGGARQVGRPPCVHGFAGEFVSRRENAGLRHPGGFDGGEAGACGRAFRAREGLGEASRRGRGRAKGRAGEGGEEARGGKQLVAGRRRRAVDVRPRRTASRAPRVDVTTARTRWASDRHWSAGASATQRRGGGLLPRCASLSAAFSFFLCADFRSHRRASFHFRRKPELLFSSKVRRFLRVMLISECEQTTGTLPCMF